MPGSRIVRHPPCRGTRQTHRIPHLDQKAFEKRAPTLARHFTKQLNIAFTDPICIFYKTTSTSKPETLILEVALTDAHFPDTAASPLSKIPVCGFVARVLDAKTAYFAPSLCLRMKSTISLRSFRLYLCPS
ncbi:MAG: hypothetical protein OSA84_03050 [Akkermansiaceae bacterium]|nr:hypothetical protein [Akkermansiaceae bacterium]